MLCILGYVANASAIDLNVHGDAIDGEGVAGAVAERAIAFGARALQALAGDAAEGGGVQHPNGGISEALGQNTAVRAATAFFIIIKFTRGMSGINTADFQLSCCGSTHGLYPSSESLSSWEVSLFSSPCVFIS